MVSEDDVPTIRPLTQEELVKLCEIAAEFIGMDAVLEMLERHAYGGTVH
jgi:hypothetical protein